ncbi:T9SS type A sorting domain-containing protein [Aquimarina sp. MMG016]|uniref:T9SS type A sorting domain-containing protein n=1 Tax=Aquimarina sp. MMG016 TaxID=2822690 RepID=UPI001B3A6A1F|nr:T9SS type A sorting domain-containing protein [Aquimarina sp. MMG016]MBQ4820607.1 T9SS type A sorting domain-containing protein [Aquimarina sp. MMG016]
MKHINSIKSTCLFIVTLLVTSMNVKAQDIHFTFANAQKTIENGEYYYEVDVMIQSSEAFKLGSGQLYLTYNPEAFGENISKARGIEYNHEAGYIVGEKYTFPAYKSFVQNDNTKARVSFAFQQGVSAESMTRENVTPTPQPLFHVKMKYVDLTKDPMVAFAEGDVYQNQFFTACGSMLKSGVKAGFPDCANLPGEQLHLDTYDSSGASLKPAPIEEELNTLNLYPNPAQEYFIVRGLDATTMDINILDINGKLIKHIPNYNLEDTITVSELQAGVYFVQIHAKGIQKNYKLIRQ